MDQGNKWRPLLEGRLAEEAWEAVDAIVHDLDQMEVNDPSLPSGLAGMAILYTYLAVAKPSQGHEDTAVKLIERAIDLTAEAPPWRALHGGYTGVAWAVEHMRGRVLDPDNDDLNEEIVEVLLEQLAADTWEEGDYDLISGLVGIGVFALERLPHPSGRALLERVIYHLKGLAREVPGGVTWFTPPSHVGPRQRGEYPDGYYNLGVAHGVPGVTALLSLALRAGVGSETAEELTRASVAWILSQRSVGQPGWEFPSWVSPGAPAAGSRTAWCYGDAGVAASLFHAGQAIDEQTWVRQSTTVAREAAGRPHELTGVADGGLCHGCAGLAHIFNRFHQATEDTVLGEAASTWYQRLLRQRQPGRGVGGFVALDTDADFNIIPSASPGLLIGASGVALGLLGALTPIEPGWDRAFLLSLQTRSHRD